MHFDFIAEGWKPDLDQMEEWLNTRSFQIPFKDKDGKITMSKVPGALRPRRAYSYIFPREYLQIVINSLQPERCVSRHDGYGSQIGSFATTFLRKGLRLKKFPDIEPKGRTFSMVKNNIRLVGLGYREDIDIEQNGITHEGL